MQNDVGGHHRLVVVAILGVAAVDDVVHGLVDVVDRDLPVDAEVVGAAREIFNELTAPDEAPIAKGLVKGAGKGDEKRDPAAEKGDVFPAPDLASDPALLASLAASRGLTDAPPGWLAADAGERAQAMLADASRQL